MLIVFNASAAEPDDDIPLMASLSAMPPHLLAAIFHTSPEVFTELPRSLKTLGIVPQFHLAASKL